MDAYDFTLNPYSGCSFGCAYCYAAFFSRNEEKRDSWGEWVNVKENAVALMAKRRPGSLDGKLIYMSSVTDPYQPVERELNLTRGILEIMAERHKPKLVVQTRSPLVARDCDLLRQIEDKGGRVQVNMTVTTDDEDIRRKFEPYCPGNHRRLEATKEVQAAGIDTCITMTPLLLVNNNGDFADELIGTGVTKFIAQPFHFVRGKFVASTREGALSLMAEKLGCGRDDFGPEYLGRYQEFFEILNNRLLDNGLPPLGEGKDGFAPPF
ncbi:MAG: radical SAM protein [Chloroflexi bacterium]|nr:radical SAM protein [Chloroflexota bacterium]